MRLICSKCGDSVCRGSNNLCRVHYNEYMKSYMLARYYRRRDKFIESRGGLCERCGSRDDLEIDHIIAEEKAFDLGRALSGWAQHRIDEELKKCQILCKSCHELKTRHDNARILGHRVSWEHGTLGGYRYCKCNLCKEAKRTYMKVYRSKIK